MNAIDIMVIDYILKYATMPLVLTLFISLIIIIITIFLVRKEVKKGRK